MAWTKQPPTWRGAEDPLAVECGVQTISFKKPCPPGLPCHYCGEVANARDHIVADSIGGVDAWWNLVPACIPCNSTKADRQWCGCAFCLRAFALWHLGFRRTGISRGDRIRKRRAAA